MPTGIDWLVSGCSGNSGGGGKSDFDSSGGGGRKGGGGGSWFGCSDVGWSMFSSEPSWLIDSLLLLRLAAPLLLVVGAFLDSSTELLLLASHLCLSNSRLRESTLNVRLGARGRMASSSYKYPRPVAGPMVFGNPDLCFTLSGTGTKIFSSICGSVRKYFSIAWNENLS